MFVLPEVKSKFPIQFAFAKLKSRASLLIKKNSKNVWWRVILLVIDVSNRVGIASFLLLEPSVIRELSFTRFKEMS